MKLFNANIIRDWDAYTIENEPISSIDLMERAARQCCYWILERFATDVPIYIFSGMGNNGGDGLALARMLIENGYKPKVYIIAFTPEGSEDFTLNLNRLDQYDLRLEDIKTSDALRDIELGSDCLIVDAIFGSGLNRIPEGIAADTIRLINLSNALRISIDIPSGMFCTFNDLMEDDLCVNADFTLSFQTPKLAFLLPEAGERAGEIHLLDIGLSRSFELKTETEFHLLERAMASELLYARNTFTHKGSYGHTAIVAGSQGKYGAAILCARACLRTGAGLLTVHIADSGWQILQTAVPEAMIQINAGKKCLSGVYEKGRETHIACGPGIGTNEETENYLTSLLTAQKTPMVLDADALNILAKEERLIELIPEYSILTPHPKEFERLVGPWQSDKEKLGKLTELAAKYNIYVVLKGAYSVIASPDGKFYFNASGNPGMATAGSGDVLTGIIVSLLAQRYTSLEACILGCYLHGISGDFAAMEKTQESMIASDIIENLGKAFKYIQGSD
jgi:NAD(P)H-hydrate epimerase